MVMPKIKVSCLKCNTYDPKQKGKYKCACVGTCPGLWMRKYRPDAYPKQEVKVKKLYAIATKVNQTYGHGDHGSELMICKTGSYGTGDFHPLFTKKSKAEKYLKELDFNFDMEVVPITIKD